VRLSPKRFEKLVLAALDSIPEPIRARMDNIDVVVDDEPTPHQRATLELAPDEVLFGLYEGTPLIERGILSDPLMPDKITIFKRALEDACDSEEEITDLQKEIIDPGRIYDLNNPPKVQVLVRGEFCEA